jgi:predicted CXXCH cytochrome family protein
MKRLRSLLASLLVGACAASAIGADQCITCHQTRGDKPTAAFKHDIHFAKGISCAACHGGDASAANKADAMSPAAGYTGVPKGDSVSVRCASCHGDSARMKSYGSSLPTNQWALLQGSVHAKLSVSGKEHIVQCITCHNAHGIVPVKDPASPVYALNVVATCSKCHSDAAFMREYNAAMPVDQVEKYRTSVHGKLNAKGDAHVAECASCHGSHDIRGIKDVKSSVYATNIPDRCASCHSSAEYMKGYKIPTDQYEKYAKSVHGIALLQRHDVGAPACNDCHGNHGAAPPGVEEVSKVCGTCHALNADLFSSSPHKKAFDEQQLPECETCHSNHDIAPATDKLLGVDGDAICASCHSEQDASSGYRVAKNMRLLTDSLASAEVRASALLDEGEQKGMEVSESRFKLRDAHQARLQSRTMVHSFNEAKFREVVDKGIATAAVVGSEGSHAIDEYYFRRWGLGIATLIISVVALSLFAVIRRIERRQRAESNTHG